MIFFIYRSCNLHRKGCFKSNKLPLASRLVWDNLQLNSIYCPLCCNFLLSIRSVGLAEAQIRTAFLQIWQMLAHYHSHKTRLLLLFLWLGPIKATSKYLFLWRSLNVRFSCGSLWHRKSLGSKVRQITKGLDLLNGADLFLFIHIVCSTSTFALK